MHKLYEIQVFSVQKVALKYSHSAENIQLKYIKHQHTHVLFAFALQQQSGKL